MNSTRPGLLSVVMGSAALVASPPVARAQPWGGSEGHGAIVVTQKTVRAIATGLLILPMSALF